MESSHVWGPLKIKSLYLKIFFMVLLGFLLTGCDNKEASEFLSFPPLGLCHIDTPANGSRIDSTQNTPVSGWGFYKTNDNIPDQVTLYLLNQSGGDPYIIFLKRSRERKDVAAAFKRPKLINSGMEGSIVANTIAPGRYELFVLQSGRYDGSVRCDNNVKHYIDVF